MARCRNRRRGRAELNHSEGADRCLGHRLAPCATTRNERPDTSPTQRPPATWRANRPNARTATSRPQTSPYLPQLPSSCQSSDRPPLSRPDARPPPAPFRYRSTLHLLPFRSGTDHPRHRPSFMTGVEGGRAHFGHQRPVIIGPSGSRPGSTVERGPERLVDPGAPGSGQADGSLRRRRPYGRPCQPNGTDRRASRRASRRTSSVAL
jgi:hypothetical protein